MLLTIDIGNTSTAVAVFQGEEIILRKRMPTPEQFNETMLDFLIPENQKKRIERTICSSVVPPVDGSLSALIKKMTGTKPLFVSPELDLGMDLKIDTPSEMGADRIADCVGALTLFSPPLIVIDSGTATTFDLINERREFIGGAILPGLEISLKSLAENTAKLPEIQFTVPDSPVGKNTVDNIRSGIYYGYLGAVSHLIVEFKRILGPDTLVTATGGLTRTFRHRIPEIDREVPDLLFIGLKTIAGRNS